MKESEQERWQELMRGDPFGKPTFTMAHIRRIEEKAGRGERERSPARKYYLAGAAAMLGIVIAAGIGIYSSVHPFGANLPSGPAPITLPATTPTASASVSATAIPKPSASLPLYSLKSEAEVLEKPEAYTSAPSLFVANPGPYYLVKERRDGFVQVTNVLSSQWPATGWIPEWYLRTDEASSQAEKIEPYQMIVASPIAFRLYPDEPQPSGFELEPGKVVQVTARYGDWMRINIVTYDSPYVGDKWVPASALEAWDPAKAKEGLLRPGAKVYAEDGSEIEAPTALNPIHIEKETFEERYRIGAPGGYVGIIGKTDFIPGPFLKVVDQPGVISPIRVIDQMGSIQAGWMVPESEREAYDAYRKQPSDEKLKGLQPMDVFRYYVDASYAADYETVYALFIQDSEYDIPSREMFLSDVQSDSGLEERGKKAWDKYMQKYDKLEQRIDGDTAIIAMIDSDEGKTLEREMNFRLIRNKAGIWKVGWMPLQ